MRRLEAYRPPRSVAVGGARLPAEDRKPPATVEEPRLRRRSESLDFQLKAGKRQRDYAREPTERPAGRA
jgi:hypothetical protein